jgi:hypothetical protein
MRKLFMAVAVLTLTTGCYHATVETGLTPSNKVVEKQWAHGFLFGLVPPSEVETVSKCPSGVAKVETQQSFLNLVANALTGGLYSPMSIKATCATSRSASLPVVRDSNVARAMKDAVDLSVATGTAVNVEVR